MILKNISQNLFFLSSIIPPSRTHLPKYSFTLRSKKIQTLSKIIHYWGKKRKREVTDLVAQQKMSTSAIDNTHALYKYYGNFFFFGPATIYVNFPKKNKDCIIKGIPFKNSSTSWTNSLKKGAVQIHLILQKNSQNHFFLSSMIPHQESQIGQNYQKGKHKYTWILKNNHKNLSFFL